MRKLTTYSRPPLRTMMNSCFTPEEVGKFVERLNHEVKDAAPKTRRRWLEAADQQLALISAGVYAEALKQREALLAEREKALADRAAAQKAPELITNAPSA